MLSLLLIAAMLVSVLCMGVSATGTYDEVSIGTGEPVTINWTTATTGTVVNVEAISDAANGHTLNVVSGQLYQIITQNGTESPIVAVVKGK